MLFIILLDAHSGKITINGQNITDVELDSLRRAIAIIPQDSVLFNDTIYYNIHYGNINTNEEQVLILINLKLFL